MASSSKAVLRRLIQQDGRSLADHLFLFGWLRRAAPLSSVGWAVVAFALYYLLPLLLCAVEGIAISPALGKQLSEFSLGWIGSWTSRHVAGHNLPYLNDATHLMMSLTIAVGTALCLHALNRFYPTLDSITSSEILTIPSGELQPEERKLNVRLRSKGIMVILAIIAACCGAVLYHNGRNSPDWWGYPAHGPAGLIVAIIGALGAFYGGHALYLVAAGQECIAHLLNHPVKLHPFHPDGCNGFSHLGNYLILLFCVCIDGGMATWLTIRRGYLGIQNFPGIWVLALGFLICVPIILIHPLFRATYQIRKAQLARLATVEQLLQPILDKIEQQLPGSETRTELNEELKSLRDLHQIASDIYETSVFPFNVKIGSTLGVGYALQVLAVVKEIYDKLKK
jgi:hypothetical protein